MNALMTLTTIERTVRLEPVRDAARTYLEAFQKNAFDSSPAHKRALRRARRDLTSALVAEMPFVAELLADPLRRLP